jgi:hypothetical protein
LGPQGLGLISVPVLSALDPAVEAALAAVGVLVGLDVRLRRPGEGRLLAGSSLEAAITLVTVTGGVLIVHALSSTSETPWLFAVMLGICAAPSSTVMTASTTLRESPVTRVGDLDNVVPILLGAVTLAASARPGSPGFIAALVVQAALIAVITALAARWLITQTASDNEQRVFAIGALLLLGGVAAQLSLSGLAAGFIAGLFWNLSGSPARDRIARDVEFLQHPLIVLLLVVAGAHLEFSTGLAGFVAAYIVFRTAGKLVGGWLTLAIAQPAGPGGLGLSLLSPGLVGIAFALDALLARGDTSNVTTTPFMIVVAGSLGSELLALVASHRRESA